MLNSGQNFLSCVTLKFDRWPWKTIRHCFYATSSFVHHFTAITQFNSGNAKFGSKSAIFFVLWDLEIWRMTLKNNRAPLLILYQLKIYVSFHSHLWIKTGVTACKRPNWGKIWVEFCDLDLWFLTLTFCMDITSVNGNNSWKFHDDMMMGR